jgi:MFS family permease
MFFLFGITSSLVTVFMPLILHVLYGISLLSAGYVNALLSLAWTALALGSASLDHRLVRRAVLCGPLLILFGVLGLRACVIDGPLAIIAISVAMVGAGIGLCYAHISSWTMAAARAGEESLTAAAIPTIQSLGIAFGAAVAGLVANAAGLVSGVSPAAVAATATWVSLLGIIAPTALVILSGRLLWLQRQYPCDRALQVSRG